MWAPPTSVQPEPTGLAGLMGGWNSVNCAQGEEHYKILRTLNESGHGRLPAFFHTLFACCVYYLEVYALEVSKVYLAVLRETTLSDSE